MEQYYELLGLSIGATIPEINASFRRLSLKLHPDKNTNNPEATINFQKLSEARNVLVKQKEYEEKTNKIWKENLKKQQAEQETFQNKQKEEILAKQKFKIFKKEIDQKMKKNYIELLPKILDFKIELKKLEKELLTLQSKSSKLRKSIINLNTKKINPRINFYIKCITLGFYDWNKITEKELCENKNEFIKTNREKENLKEKYDIVKTNMQILINEQNLLQEDLKELFAKENDLKKYINSFNLEEKDWERTDVVNNIQICLKIIKLDENNFDFNMQLYVNLNTWKILVNNNTYFYKSKILIKVYFNKFLICYNVIKSFKINRIPLWLLSVCKVRGLLGKSLN